MATARTLRRSAAGRSRLAVAPRSEMREASDRRRCSRLGPQAGRPGLMALPPGRRRAPWRHAARCAGGGPRERGCPSVNRFRPSRRCVRRQEPQDRCALAQAHSTVNSGPPAHEALSTRDGAEPNRPIKRKRGPPPAGVPPRRVRPAARWEKISTGRSTSSGRRAPAVRAASPPTSGARERNYNAGGVTASMVLTWR